LGKRRFAPAGFCYHIVNRGNDRRPIFFGDGDYRRFLQLLESGKRRYAVRLYGVCLIGNHVHAVVYPEAEGALSSYVGWVFGRYACQLRTLTKTTGHGHVFQRRFWSDGIENQEHFVAVLRYVEANPVRARLVKRALDWPWSSLAIRARSTQTLLDPLPFELPNDWPDVVDNPQSRLELAAIRFPDRRGRKPVPNDIRLSREQQ
jgi:putative transposase